MVGQPGLLHVGACSLGENKPPVKLELCRWLTALSPIIVLEALCFLARKKHGRAWNSCCEQMPAAFSRPPWIGPDVSLTRGSGSMGCCNAGCTWKSLAFMGDDGKHQGLPIWGPEHMLLLYREHLGTLDPGPLNVLSASVLVLRVSCLALGILVQITFLQFSCLLCRILLKSLFLWPYLQYLLSKLLFKYMIKRMTFLKPI